MRSGRHLDKMLSGAVEELQAKILCYGRWMLLAQVITIRLLSMLQDHLPFIRGHLYNRSHCKSYRAFALNSEYTADIEELLVA